MTNLFISYDSGDTAKVDAIVARLRSVQNDDGSKRYSVWQDKTNIAPGSNRRSSIFNAIGDCDVFLFFLSRNAVKNDMCLAALSYAQEIPRPIVVIVPTEEYVVNELSDTFEPSFNDPLFTKMDPREFLYYKGAAFFPEFEWAIENLRLDSRAKLAPPIYVKSFAGQAINHGHDLYDDAYNQAQRGNFAEADRLFRKLDQLGNDGTDERFKRQAQQWIVILKEYQRLMEMNGKQVHEYRKQWKAYEELCNVEFLGRPFNPHHLQPDQPPLAALSAPTAPLLERLRALLDLSFDTYEVPAGPFQYGPETWLQSEDGKAFAISKHPISWNQFQAFHVRDHRNAPWWEGWPPEVNSLPKFKPSASHFPCIGVSWYMALAFCRWLSYELQYGYALHAPDTWVVRLPTEHEWENAARCTELCTYPHDPLRGRIWEWCLNVPQTSQTDLTQHKLNGAGMRDPRPLRGGRMKEDRVVIHTNQAYRADAAEENMGFRVVVAMEGSA